MKLIIFLLLYLIILPDIAFPVQEVSILVEDKNFAPFVFNDKDGKVTGIYPEIVKKAISRMPDYTVKFIEVPWIRAKLYIKEGRYFAMLPPYFHAHDWLTDKKPKRPYIWPYSLPLFTQTDVVMGNAAKLNSFHLKWPEDYKGLSFAMLRGDGIAGYKFDQMVKKKKIKVKLFNSNLEAIKHVLLGKSDFTVISKMPLYWLIKELKRKGKYSKLARVDFKTKHIRSNEGYLGYTDINAEKNFPYKKDFSIKFDIEIYKMKKNGEIKKIIDLYRN